MRPAELFLISTPDDHIVESCNALSASGLLRTGDIVFHCSGALASTDLVSAQDLDLNRDLAEKEKKEQVDL